MMGTDHSLTSRQTRCSASKLSNNVGRKGNVASTPAGIYISAQEHTTRQPLEVSIWFHSSSRPVSSGTVEVIDAFRSKSDALVSSVRGLGWCSPLTSHRMYLSVCLRMGNGHSLRNQ